MDIQNACANFQSLPLKTGVDIWTLVRKTCEIFAVAFDLLSFSMGPTLGDRYALMLALRTEIFE